MTKMTKAGMLAGAGIVHLTTATILSLILLAGRPVPVTGSVLGFTPTFTPPPTDTPTAPPSTDTPTPPTPTETPTTPTPTETPTTPPPTATPVPPPPPRHAPHLTIAKMADPAHAPPGGQVTFTIRVCNDGDATADNVVVSDALPPELKVVSASASQGTVTVEGNGVRAELGSLAPGACADVTIVARVRAGAAPGTQITNMAVTNGQTSGGVTVTIACLLPESGGTTTLAVVVGLLAAGVSLLTVGIYLASREGRLSSSH